MHHQPTTQTTLFHPLSTSALHRSPVSSDCLRHPPVRPSTPRNTILASRLVSWYPTLHFSSTLRAHPPFGTTTELVRLPPPPPPRFCTLHRADTLGVLNGIVATLLLATSKCRRRRLRRKRIRRQRRRYLLVAVEDEDEGDVPALASFHIYILVFRCSKLHFVFGSIDISANGNAIHCSAFFFTFDNIR